MSRFTLPPPGNVLLGDGGISTELQRAGLGAGELPEGWSLTQPKAVVRVHREHRKAGAGWSTANTFGANTRRLAEFGLSATLVRAAVYCARLGAPGLPVLGSIGPVAGLANEARSFYVETVVALTGAGVDAFLVETIVDLASGVAAVESAAAAGAGPVIACFTPGADGNLLDGTSPERAAAALTRAGAAVVGANCGFGPVEMLDTVRRLAAAEEGPVMAAPNAGLPTMAGGRPTYDLTPDSFARAAIEFRQAGASLIAGCCGVSPEHIRAAFNALTAQSPEGVERVA